MAIRGISFPFQKGTTSLPKTSEDNDVIAENIQRILLTRKGERVMRPGTGSGVWDFVFENTGAVLNARIDNDVRQAIAEGEPRAVVLQVNVTEEDRADGDINVLVTVTYSVNLDVQQTTVTLGTVSRIGG
jgi:phage baseplate assembly protein W